MKLDELVATLLQEMHKIGTTRTVVGEPIAVGETHVVPVCELSVGFATAGGSGSGPLISRRRLQGAAEGGGAGGGVSVTPVAFVVVDPAGRARLESLKHHRASALSKAVDLIPRLADRLLKDKQPEDQAKTEQDR